ncbi:MAG TPA: MoaD/ThiS family protein [Candidatus Binataceae bacterium]|nr:MoaD/ThiS family protein [Candidatus Binataceae bacterium]
MQVSVRFFGNYRALVDSPQFTFEIAEEQATPLNVLDALTERYGEKMRTALIVNRGGEVRLKPGIKIAVGDEIIDFSSDLRTPLEKGSYTSEKPIRVFIFPSLMGGR